MANKDESYYMNHDKYFKNEISKHIETISSLNIGDILYVHMSSYFGGAEYKVQVTDNNNERICLKDIGSNPRRFRPFLKRKNYIQLAKSGKNTQTLRLSISSTADEKSKYKEEKKQKESTFIEKYKNENLNNIYFIPSRFLISKLELLGYKRNEAFGVLASQCPYAYIYNNEIYGTNSKHEASGYGTREIKDLTFIEKD